MEKIFKTINGYRDEIISFQGDLTSKVALGPDNGGMGEHEKARYLVDKLKALSPESVLEINAPDSRAEDGFRPNIAAQWNKKQDSPAIWVLSHMDIVPPGDLSLWNSDPYEVQVDGDRIIGRGVEDNQHGIVSSYLALRAIFESGLELENPVGLVFVADEETGSEFGLEYILNNHGNLFEPEDLIIVPDCGNRDGSMIEVAEKSMLWVKFTITGIQCHASTPEKGKKQPLRRGQADSGP